jgi:16S rRNA (uracil1498-N3)-methyltransferase
MNLFYTPGISADTYILNEEESRHCIKVLRLQNGDIIHSVDGKGGFYTSQIIEEHPKKCMIRILEVKKDFGKRTFFLHIAIAPTKNIERFEWFLEKATEIGIDEISPLICEHSERKEIKNERLEKVILSAAKQSIKAYFPKLNTTISFKSLVKTDFNGQKFIAHCSKSQNDTNEKPHLKFAYKQGQNVLILIGPEGDFSPAEIRLALENGFTEISLGTNRLRTETAALVACNTVNLVNEPDMIRPEK